MKAKKTPQKKENGSERRIKKHMSNRMAIRNMDDLLHDTHGIPRYIYIAVNNWYGELVVN